MVTAINSPDAANGVIPADDMASAPVDWSGPARVTIGDDVVASGQVIEAVPDDDGNVRWDVRSALMLSENRMPAMVIQNLAPQEVVYAAAREAGFGRAHMQILGLDGLGSEAMWVIAPIRGLEVGESTRVGVVEFVDGPTGAEMLRRFDPALDPSLIRSFASARVFARVAVVASLIYDAEQEGLSLIDTAAAWLTARVRYAWSELPAGSLQPYIRTNTRAEIARQDSVSVIAVDGARRWWRGTEVGPRADTVGLAGDSAWTRPRMPTHAPEADRDTLLAIQRASTERDPIQRVAAFWEAIEFYVGNRGTRKLFDDKETSAIIDRATSGLPDSKAIRVQRLLEDLLNNESLMTRLRRVLDEDSVPLTDDELALLRRLRRQRNRVVHGAHAVPAHHDLDRAIAIVSRAIVIRWQSAT